MRSLIVVKRNRFGKQFFKAFERICTVRNQIFIFNNTINSFSERVFINIICSRVLKRVHTCQLQELFRMILPATVRMENDTCNLMIQRLTKSNRHLESWNRSLFRTKFLAMSVKQIMILAYMSMMKVK